jgi:hypothetical protein
MQHASLPSTGQTFLDSAMCANVALTTFRASMSLRVGSRAKTLAPLAKRPELMERGPDCGVNTPDSLASYDPATCSWRTSQTCLFGGWEEYSATFPRSGTMRSGQLYQRALWVPHIHESACSSLPTLTVVSAEHPGRIRIKPDQQDCLSAAVARRDGHLIGGQLNPEWTAWFMGFPALWTDLED